MSNLNHYKNKIMRKIYDFVVSDCYSQTNNGGGADALMMFIKKL